MPHYYIDIADGSVQSRDDVGEDFPDAETARLCAIAHLPALADDPLPDREARDFSVTLRSETGVTLYVARLSYHAEWMSDALCRRIA